MPVFIIRYLKARQTMYFPRRLDYLEDTSKVLGTNIDIWKLIEQICTLRKKREGKYFLSRDTF